MPTFLLKRRLECCENCLSHVRSQQCGCSMNCNQQHVPTLLTCANCKEVRYCSKQCQKAQWKEHKHHCEAHMRILSVVSLQGPEVQLVFKAFVKFCKVIRSYLEVPAVSALELHLGKERLNTHVFFVQVRAKVTVLKKTSNTIREGVTFKLVSAECRTMEQMHELLDWRYGPFPFAPEATELSLAHRPNLLRIFVMDVSGLLPFQLDGYTLPTDPANLPPDHNFQYDPDWLDKLLESIGQRKTEQMVGEEEIAGFYFAEED